MKNTNQMKKVLAILLIICFVAAFGMGCSTKSTETEVAKETMEEKAEATAEAKEETVEKEYVELTVLLPTEDGANAVNQYIDNNVIYNKISEDTNCSFKVVGWSDEKTKMAIAGGDLPDMVCVLDDITTIMHDANMLVDLEPLINSIGSKMLTDAPAREAYSRGKFDDGHVWFVLPNAQQVDTPTLPVITNDVYPTMRWDYYAELGYPEINSFDDLLSILEQMVANHPTTEDGKKVYGLASFTDWGGFWAYSMTTGIVQGMPDPPQNLYAKKLEDETLISNILDSESPLWQAALLMNKAQRKGLLHPDSFTMKFTDFEAAAVRGEILYGPTIYQMQKANVELAKEGTEFLGIPFNFGYSYFEIGNKQNDDNYLGFPGWSEKNWSITTSCEYPERAIELLDYCFSMDGSRLIKSGIEGVHWDYVDGEPQMKQEIIDLKLAGGEEWSQTCLEGTTGSLKFFCGFDSGVIHPDGYPVDLLAVPSTYKLLLTETQKDFCEYYNVEYPMQEWWDRAAEGVLEFNPRADVTIQLPTAPEDIKAINTKLEDMVLKGLPRCILEPTTDEEFETAMNELMDELRAEDAEVSLAWAQEEWAKARAEKYGE